MSEDLVRSAHPSWNATSITAEAKRQFEAAARAFFTFTTLKQLRPRIKWTHHAYPVLVCYDAMTPAADRARNDDMLWLYEMLDVLMPSIYLQPLGSYSNGGADCNANETTLLRQVLSEAVRVAEAVGKKLGRRPTPVVPLTWPRTEIPGDNRVENKSWFEVEMLTAFEFPYTEAVQVWGNEAFAWSGDDATDGGNCTTAAKPGRCDTRLNLLMESHGGATAIDQFVRERCDCSRTTCSGHGRCYGKRGNLLRYGPRRFILRQRHRNGHFAEIPHSECAAVVNANNY